MCSGSRTQPFRLVVLLSCSLALLALPAFAQAPADLKAYVMDADKKIVQSVTLVSGAIVESAKFEVTPSLMVLSPDGGTLLVFQNKTNAHRADARWKGGPILRPDEPTALSILDAHDLKPIARIEDVGWNAVAQSALPGQAPEISAAWDESGKLLTILAWGRKDRQPELVQVDVPKARVAGRYPLACETDEVNPLLKVSNNLAAVLHGNREDKKGREGATHKLVLINLANVAESKEISLPGIARDLERSSDGGTVFVLADDGVKNKQGQAHLHVVSAASKSLLRSTDGGYFLIDTMTDDASGLTLIARLAHGGKSTVYAFQGDKQKAELEIPDVTLKFTLAPKTKRVYILCYNSVQVLDLETVRLLGSIPTPHRKRGVWESGRRDRPPSSLALDSAETLGVLSYSGDDESSVLDLKDFTVKGTIDLVSGGKAFARTMLVAAATGAVAGAGSAAAGVPIAPVMVPTGYAPQYSSSLVDPSGEVVYILGPGHVHVADLKTYKKVSSIGLGFFPSYAFFSPPAAGPKRVLFVAGIDIGFVSRSYRMAAISTTTKDKLLDQKWLAHCAYTSDGKYALNYDSETVYLMDGSTLSITKTVGGFKDLRQLLLAPQSAPGSRID